MDLTINAYGIRLEASWDDDLVDFYDVMSRIREHLENMKLDGDGYKASPVCEILVRYEDGQDAGPDAAEDLFDYLGFKE